MTTIDSPRSEAVGAAGEMSAWHLSGLSTRRIEKVVKRNPSDSPLRPLIASLHHPSNAP
jgi:hypothetical protein